VTALPPGVEDEELEQLLVESNASVECTRSLLTALITGEVLLPEVTEFALDERVPIESPEVDEDMERLRLRLGRAGKILQQKRARQH